MTTLHKRIQIRRAVYNMIDKFKDDIPGTKVKKLQTAIILLIYEATKTN